MKMKFYGIKRGSAVPKFDNVTELYNWTDESLSHFMTTINYNKNVFNKFIRGYNCRTAAQWLAIIFLVREMYVAEKNLIKLNRKVNEMEEEKKES